MTLPNDLKDFLLLVIAQPLVLGAVVAALLQGVFWWWSQTHVIRDHDKTLIAALAPPVAAALFWVVAAALGYRAWDWADLAQAVWVGVLASVGGQVVYGTYRKVTSSPAPQPDPKQAQKESTP